MAYRNILIIKLSSIGDVIHAMPVACAVKERYPAAHITWMVESAAYELAAHNPYVDETLLFDKRRCKTLAGIVSYLPELTSVLRAREFDLALDLQGLGKSAVLAWLSRAKEKLVYCNAREGSQLVSRRVCGEHSENHVVERYLDVARHIGCPVGQTLFPLAVPEREKEKAAGILQHAGVKPGNRFVALAPATNWRSKCWPLPHFAALGDKLYEAGCIPVITGSDGDRQLAAAIAAGMVIPPIDLTGKVSLLQLAFVLQQAAAFVGGDTGPMHLAAAMGTPVVALFGPTDPLRNGPYQGENTVLTSPVDCAGCWRRECPKGEECLSRISVEAVYAALRRHMSC